MKDYIIPLSQCFESPNKIIRRRQARLESGPRKRWLFFKSRHVFLTAITFLILFWSTFAGASALEGPFASGPTCRNNLNLTEAIHTTGSQQYEYKWEGTCQNPCAGSLTYGTVTLNTSYDGAKHKAAEKLTFTAGVTCEVEISMTGCLYNPFTDLPILNGCGNRLVAVNGCNEAYSLVPDNGLITERMVPKNVAYSEGGSPPPPPPSSPPKGAYEVKRIISPAGSIPDKDTEITFALEPRLSKYPPKRIVAHWELAPKNANKQSGTQLEVKKGIKGGPMPTVGWTYYEKVPTNWYEFPRKISTSFFPLRGKTYRVRVYAETLDGQWIGPTEWSYFSIGTIIEKKQKSFPQIAKDENKVPRSGDAKRFLPGHKDFPVLASPALEIISPTNLQTVNVDEDWLYIVVEVKPGFDVDGYVLEMERLEEASWQPTGSLHIPSLLPLPILIKTASLIEGIPGSYRVRVRGSKAGYVGGYTQWRRFCIGPNQNCQRTVQKTEFLEKQVTQPEKGGGFVPKSGKKTMQTMQGESSLGPEDLKVQKMQRSKTIVTGGKMEPRSGDAKLFDGSGPLPQFEGGQPILKIISPTNLQTVSVKANGTFPISPKTNPGFEFPSGIGLYFERQEEIPKTKEVAIPDKGATHWWVNAFVANWGWPIKDGPMSVNESMLGGPGFYRVRIRGLSYLQGEWEGIGGWTPWRYFCIGPNENCSPKLTQATPGATVMELSNQERDSGKMKKGSGFVPQKKEVQVQTISPLVTSGSITGTLGGSKRKMTSSSDITQKSKVKSEVATIQVPKPNIIVQSIDLTTPKGRKQGEPFYEGEGTTLSVSFKNIGKAKSGKNHKYTISCKVNSGGPECPVKNETKFIAKEFNPNDTALVKQPVMLKKAGEYDVTVKVTGEGSDYQKKVKLNVVKKLKIQPKSKTKTMRTVPVVK